MSITQMVETQESIRNDLNTPHNSLADKIAEGEKRVTNIRQEYAVLAEYKIIQTENIPGVYVIPSRQNYLEWFGVVFVRSGIYEDGIFRFTIQLDENFPNATVTPKIFFDNLFHPCVNPDTKELNLSRAFPTWSRKEQRLWQVLKFVHWMFKNFDGSLHHAVDNEAASFYRSNREEYINKVKQLVEESQEHIYDQPSTNDQHYITFEKYDPEVHELTRMEMFSRAKEDFNRLGHSWVLPGSFTSLGRAPSPTIETES